MKSCSDAESTILKMHRDRYIDANMIKLVIFDYDDTLVRSHEYLYNTDTQTARSLGLIPVSRNAYFSLWGKPHSEMVANLYPNVDTQKYMQEYERIYRPEDLKFFEDTEAVLKKLSEKGFGLAIISAKQKGKITEHLDKNGLSGYFQYIHGAESSPYKKPDPRIFNDILTFFKLKPSEVVFVGDQLSDFEAANKAGINFVAVTTGVNTEEEFSRIGCRKIEKDLTSCAKTIGLINKSLTGVTH